MKSEKIKEIPVLGSSAELEAAELKGRRGRKAERAGKDITRKEDRKRGKIDKRIKNIDVEEVGSGIEDSEKVIQLAEQILKEKSEEKLDGKAVEDIIINNEKNMKDPEKPKEDEGQAQSSEAQEQKPQSKEEVEYPFKTAAEVAEAKKWGVEDNNEISKAKLLEMTEEKKNLAGKESVKPKIEKSEALTKGVEPDFEKAKEKWAEDYKEKYVFSPDIEQEKVGKPETPVIEKEDSKYEDKETSWDNAQILKDQDSKNEENNTEEDRQEFERSVDFYRNLPEDQLRLAQERMNHPDFLPLHREALERVLKEKELKAAEGEAEKAFAGTGKGEKSDKEKWEETKVNTNAEFKEFLREKLNGREKFSSKNEIVDLTQEFLLKKLGWKKKRIGILGRDIEFRDEEGKVVCMIKGTGLGPLRLGKYRVVDGEGNFLQDLPGGFNRKKIETPKNGSHENKRLSSNFVERALKELSPSTEFLQNKLKDKIREDIKSGAWKGTAENK
jgi:hypothetical protein